MHILITGAAGFLGSHLARLLTAQGHHVTALTHAALDICNPTAVDDAISHYRPQWVVHCAAIASTAYCREHPEASLAVNVEGTLHIARACRTIGARLVYCSSDQVYAPCVAHEGPLSEAVDLPPLWTEEWQQRNPYGHHKLLMEQRTQQLLPHAVALRLTWMYAPPSPQGSPATGVYANLLTALRTGVPILACAREHRGMTNVSDVCCGMAAIMAHPSFPGGVYNFGSPNAHDTFTTLSNALKSLSDNTETLVSPDTSWTRNIALDVSRMAVLGITFPDTLTALTTAANHS